METAAAIVAVWKRAGLRRPILAHGTRQRLANGAAGAAPPLVDSGRVGGRAPAAGRADSDGQRRLVAAAIEIRIVPSDAPSR